jgi:hypothetical protein
MFLRMVKERNEILKKSLVGEDIQDKDRPLKILE